MTKLWAVGTSLWDGTGGSRVVVGTGAGTAVQARRTGMAS